MTEEDPISLEFDEGAGALIFPDDAGYWLTNQVGGHACHHPTVRGFFRGVRVPKALVYYFIENLHSWCCEGISAECANYLDFVLLPQDLQIDRDRLNECEEAWLFCTYLGEKCILTWENSD